MTSATTGARVSNALAAGVAARVGGRVVTTEDVDRRLAALRTGRSAAVLPPDGTSEGRQLRRWVVQLLVTEALVEVECDRLGVDRAAAPTVGAVLPHRTAALEVGSVTAAVLTASAAARALFDAVTREVTVAEAAVDAYCDGNPDLAGRAERRHVRHVLVGDEETARAVLAELAGGADFGEVAARRSRDEGSRHRGGALGVLRRGDLAGPVERAVFAATPGDPVPPVRSGFGWHCLLVDRVEPAGPRPGVREEARARLLAAARRRRFVAWFDARRAVTVALGAGYEHPGDPRQPDNTHRH